MFPCLFVQHVFNIFLFTPVGYAFLLFREEVSVHRLVKSCLSEEGKLYMFVSSLTQSNKKVSLPVYMRSIICVCFHVGPCMCTCMYVACILTER